MWFERSLVDSEGLFIPGSPRRQCADLRFAPEGLRVCVGDVRGSLSWDRYPQEWFMSSYPQGPSGLLPPPGSSGLYIPHTGAAVYTRNTGTEITVPVLAALATARRRLAFGDPLKRAFKRGPVVPLHKPRSSQPTLYRFDSMIGILCLLLHQRAELRQGLADETRSRHLRADILNNGLAPVYPHLGMRTKSIEIRNAARACGLEHRLGGRPIPGESFLNERAAIEQVLKRLGPKAGSPGFLESDVREILQSDYYSVEPWPFGALIE
jgi:hypothetical protein